MSASSSAAPWQAPPPPVDGASALALFSDVQQRALALGHVLRSPPPLPTTCCGRGCNGCVWEGFLAAAAYWRDEALLVLEDGPVHGSAAARASA